MLEATQRPDGTSAAGPWIDEARGLISREIFTSEAIFQLELERIFARTWQFVAHETEIPNAGDFVIRTLGNDPVIVLRTPDGAVNALLNTCRHRGVKLCRGESGNAERFVCPYHGWVYDSAGNLLNTAFNQLYPEDTDFSGWGLIRVPRVSSYKGLVFASWSAAAPSLDEYLNDYRWYLDLFFARTPGGAEVLAPPHRSRVRVNWKLAAINFGTDNQHIYTTHIGPFTLVPSAVPRPDMIVALRGGVQICTRHGHSISMTHVPGDGPYWLHAKELHDLYDRTLDPRQREQLSDAVISVGNVFPNFSFLEGLAVKAGDTWRTAIVMRTWHPVSAQEIELTSWCLAEREADPNHKAVALANGFHHFGIAGLFEQEDVELWSTIGVASAGMQASRYPFNFQTALPKLNEPLPEYNGPGEAYRPFSSEITQFKFFQEWNRLMHRA